VLETAWQSLALDGLMAFPATVGQEKGFSLALPDLGFEHFQKKTANPRKSSTKDSTISF